MWEVQSNNVINLVVASNVENILGCDINISFAGLEEAGDPNIVEKQIKISHLLGNIRV